MSRVSSVAQTKQTARPKAATVRTLNVGVNCCAKCGSPDVRPSTHRTAFDVLLAWIFLTPFRCKSCETRFYRVWRPAVRRPADATRTPLLVMPARQSAPEIRPAEPQPSEPLLLKETAAIRHRPATVLIQASDLSISKLLRRLLERRGYSVIENADGQRIDTQAGDGRVDLLIVDLSADAETPMDLAPLVRAQPGLKILLLCTESTRSSDLPDSVVTLRKPFALDTFVDTVGRLLK